MNHQLINNLLSKRDALLNKIAAIGDFRPGKLYQRFKKCSNKNCHCHKPDSKKHGPYWYLSRKKKGQKTITHVIPDDSLDTTKHHLENYDVFGELITELVEVNDQLCQARIKEGRGQKKTPLPNPVNRRSRPNSRLRRPRR